ncbi:uncharacterized protein LOC103310535 [Acyrthosiphon pisum]|uniref:Integrase catalytic domain-containing protein n=1 Tax=Acyrthosiphon pisum TaxID=7029 RepID=A0A8R2FBQ0_ACYPI|nr:uncharacterized protein LOC103310535 [Acyrthosiphon pisum]|eukprot:XP_008187368.1 PREDICTED: uncharacterized protein LOC103310535 [Acyrthosiphon pisum]
MHAGPQLVASLLSTQFWIVSGRSAIRHVIYKCVTCTRHRASMVKTLMGDLPSPRVCPSRPFSNVGIDYAGPLLVKEMVSDLTTLAFLASLKRFVARRGIPSEIYSNCGTNFQDAGSELRRLWSDPVAQNTFSNTIPCRWHFNPPAAPHFGGLWEAAVKSMKNHLKRAIGTQVLSCQTRSHLQEERQTSLKNECAITKKLQWLLLKFFLLSTMDMLDEDF